MISIILPVYNELRHGYLEKVLEGIRSQNGEYELIVVDGSSDDATLDVASKYRRFISSLEIVQAGKSNRAERMNIGAKHAKGDVFLFHHPVTVLPNGALEAIRDELEKPGVVGGGFTHQFDHSHWILKFASWYPNNIRTRRGIIYLDHCNFVKRDVFEYIGGYPEIDVFEDTVFSLEMKKRGQLKMLPSKVTTSARRFLKRGIIKHTSMNLLLKSLYNLGVNPKRLNKIYEGKNPFNVNY